MPQPSTTHAPPDASEARAIALDAADPLRSYREQFHLPLCKDVSKSGLHGDEQCVYLCGNSLGLMPKATREAVNQEMDDWARYGVEGHFHAKYPWYPYHEFVRDAAARLVGARPHEVVVMNSLTANLHLMMATFYRPEGKRNKIVIEDSAFPSDSYAVASQAAFHGLDPREAVVRLKPREGERTLRAEDIEKFLHEHGQSVALMMLGGVNYLTGQLMDMGRLTEAGHRTGAVVGWDLAHAAGNVALNLHDWNADFACWCSYKYLNSGPGAVAGCFVHEKHSKNTKAFGDPGALKRFAGWWGNDPKTRFVMAPEFAPVASADAWSLSNPPVLATAPVRVSLDIFDQATIPALRRKSEAMTNYLRGLIDAMPGADRLIEITTPRDFASRGCQFSLAVKDRPKELHKALGADGVVCDFREPNVIRIAPVPLYNTFHDCWRFAKILRKHLAPTTT